MTGLEAIREGAESVRFPIDGRRHQTIGRGERADLKFPPEPYLGRVHVEVWLKNGRLSVRRLAGARNPVFFHGADQSAFLVEPGDHFVIGRTRFVFIREVTERTETPVPPTLSRTLTAEEVYGPVELATRLRLLDLLELPEILSTRRSEEFHLHVARLLRMATGARWARVTSEHGAVLAADDDARGDGAGRMSRSLVRSALAAAPRPTLFRWGPGPHRSEDTVPDLGTDWAICAAIRPPREAALVFYVAGATADVPDRPEALEECSRFVGLVTDMVARALAVRRLEVWYDRLQRYFSAPVAERIMASRDPKELEPKLVQSTVMFFDLRGFSKRTEGRNERILEHLDELRHVMTAMTDEIFAEGGVVLQYVGDGILACWNVPTECPDHVDRACRAALRMAAGLRAVAGGWQCGIGIHTGEVVAGAIGSEQVFTYSVLGPVVNQASRIEGITKVVEVPVLVSAEVASQVSREVALPLRLGRFRPAGMRAALDLYDLLPPPGEPTRAEAYARGLAAFERGDWEESYELLDPLGPGDRPARYLKTLAETARRHPPKDWQGIIEMAEK